MGKQRSKPNRAWLREIPKPKRCKCGNILREENTTGMCRDCYVKPGKRK